MIITGSCKWTRAQMTLTRNSCHDIHCGGCRYAGIANMKMRDWESTLTQAWKNNVGTFSVLDIITNLGGMCMM